MSVKSIVRQDRKGEANMLNKKSIAALFGGLLYFAVCQIEAQAEIPPPPDTNTVGTMSAMAGFGWPNAAKDCFWNSWSLTRNSCTDTKTFLLPFHVSMAKPPQVSSYLHNLSMHIRGYGSLTEKVTCRTIVNTINNGARFSETVSTLSDSRQYQWLGIRAETGPIEVSGVQMDVIGGDVAHVECSVPKDMGLVSVGYNYGYWFE